MARRPRTTSRSHGSSRTMRARACSGREPSRALAGGPALSRRARVDSVVATSPVRCAASSPPTSKPAARRAGSIRPRPGKPSSVTEAAPTPSRTSSARSTPAASGSQLARRSGQGTWGPPPPALRSSTASAATRAHLITPGHSRVSDIRSMWRRSNSPGRAHARAPTAPALMAPIAHPRGRRAAASPPSTIAATSHQPRSSQPRSGSATKRPTREQGEGERRAPDHKHQQHREQRGPRFAPARPAACGRTSKLTEGAGPGARPSLPLSRCASPVPPAPPTLQGRCGCPLGQFDPGEHGAHLATALEDALPPPQPGGTHARLGDDGPLPQRRRCTGRRADGPAHATGSPCSSTRTSASTRHGQ